MDVTEEECREGDNKPDSAGLGISELVYHTKGVPTEGSVPA